MTPEFERIVTPFNADERVDESLLREEIEYHLVTGVHGISVCGNTSEGNALTLDEHSQLYEITVEEAGDEVPSSPASSRRAGRRRPRGPAAPGRRVRNRCTHEFRLAAGPVTRTTNTLFIGL